MPPDAQISVWIADLAGRISFLDELMRLLVSNYFAPTLIMVIMVFLWLGPRDMARRGHNQRIIIYALAATGLACLCVVALDLIQLHFGDFWSRPYENHPEAREAMNLLYFELGEPSFPSNAAAGIFAFAPVVWFADRRASATIFIIACLWGFDRVYTGIHYPLDIAGGIFIGLASAFAAFKLAIVLEPLSARFIGLARRLYLT